MLIVTLLQSSFPSRRSRRNHEKKIFGKSVPSGITCLYNIRWPVIDIVRVKKQFKTAFLLDFRSWRYWTISPCTYKRAIWYKKFRERLKRRQRHHHFTRETGTSQSSSASEQSLYKMALFSSVTRCRRLPRMCSAVWHPAAYSVWWCIHAHKLWWLYRISTFRGGRF